MTNLPLTKLAETATTITLGWTPIPCLGYVLYADGVRKSNSWDQTKSSWKTAKAAEIRVVALGTEAAGVWPPPPPPSSLPKAGISTGYLGTYNATAILNLDRCQEANAKVVRYDVASSSHYDNFGAAMHAGVTARGMESMMILHGSTSPVTAAQADTLARYVGSRTTCRLFEFCNEPDLGFRWTPEQYADAAHGFCAALRTVRPDATLILGANWKWESGSEVRGCDEWVRRVIERWGANKPSFNCWSFHMYEDPTWADDRNIWRMVFGPVPAGRIPAKTRLLAAFPNVKVISTENGGTGANRGAYITEDFAAVADGRLGMQCVYSMIESNSPPGFALCDAAGNRSADFYLYRDKAALL